MKNPKEAIVGASLATLILGGGLAIGLASSANASTSTPDPTSTSSSTDSTGTTDTTDTTDTKGSTVASGDNDGDGIGGRGSHTGGHVGANGTVEVALTGSVADSVSAAVLSANPGATIERMENDAEGAI